MTFKTVLGIKLKLPPVSFKVCTNSLAKSCIKLSNGDSRLKNFAEASRRKKQFGAFST